jgi:poly(hydroxyalkanoate) depolymerase family esterase
MRLRALLGLVLVACLLPLGAHAGAAPRSSLTKHTYTEPGGLTRSYFQYIPAGLRSGRPVVMFLHGCNQTAGEARQATHFEALADKEKFTVVFPEQVKATNSSAPAADGNGIGCWNWFLPEHQARGAGEPAVLAGIAKAVTRAVKGDRRRVYVEGVSAGAVMTVTLAATYPDVFAAAASLAGCGYSSCGDLTGALAHEAMGPRARVVPMFIENGTADVLNPAQQSINLAQSWLGTSDLADNGEMDLSVSRQPSSYDNHVPGSTPSPGSGNACVHSNSFLCLGGILGLQDYPVTRATWSDSRGKGIVELWLVHGLAHAHPNAPGDGPYTDPLGPDVTTASYRFFLQHRL